MVEALLPLIRRDSSPPGEYSVGWFELRSDLILQSARASTARYRQGKPRGLLDGVPTAIKDEFDMEGYKSCLGSVNDYTGDSVDGHPITGWCVKKLEDSGAIILGKLSMHEFGLGKAQSSRLHANILTSSQTLQETTPSTVHLLILTIRVIILVEAPRDVLMLFLLA